jgi:thioredoxin-like negative regulator of GroEL
VVSSTEGYYRLHKSQRQNRMARYFRFLKVNADEEQQLMAKFGIRSIPTLMLFSNGRVVAQSSGAMNARGIVAWVRSHAEPA